MKYSPSMEKLRRWLERTKMSQAALARELAVHPTLINHWLTGKRMPGRNKLKLLSDTTGIKIEDLL